MSRSEAKKISEQRRSHFSTVSIQADNILIRGTNWIGDAVMTLPAIAAIRKTFPRAKITILVKPWVADVFRLCPDVDDVMLYQQPGIHDGFFGILRLAGDLKERKFDAAILLQNAIEAAIISRLAGIPIRAGYNSDGRGFLLTHAVRRTKTLRKLHQVDYYLEMVKALGCQPAGREAVLTLGVDDEHRADELLVRHGLQDSRLLLGMAPGASYGPAKKWFPERFALVADRLIEAFPAQVMLFGSGADGESIAQVQQHAKSPLCALAGATNLRETMALIARCRLFISNDSGLMHLAGAMGVPVVAIFGSTNPTATSPPGHNNIIIHKDVTCSPCLKTDCPTDFRCMDLIRVDDVYEAAERMLK
jgi:heptosyltransferase-2